MKMLLTHFTIRPPDHVMQMLLTLSLLGCQMKHVRKMLLTHFTIRSPDVMKHEMQMLLTHFTIRTPDETCRPNTNVTDTFHY